MLKSTTLTLPLGGGVTSVKAEEALMAAAEVVFVREVTGFTKTNQTSTWPWCGINQINTTSNDVRIFWTIPTVSRMQNCSRDQTQHRSPWRVIWSVGQMQHLLCTTLRRCCCSFTRRGQEKAQTCATVTRVRLSQLHSLFSTWSCEMLLHTSWMHRGFEIFWSQMKVKHRSRHRKPVRGHLVNKEKNLKITRFVVINNLT